jgi:hypothetical protein
MNAPFRAVADPKRSRALALALLVAAVVAVIVAIAVPVWLLNRHYDTALAENLDKLDRYRRIAGTRPQVVRESEAMAARDPHKFYLRAGGPALSAAQAQEAIRALVESSGGRLITIGAPVTHDDGRYRQVSINVQLTANIFAMLKILGSVESNTPYLFVDNATIRTQVPASYRPAPGADPEMFLQFDVYGYSLGAAK